MFIQPSVFQRCPHAAISLRHLQSFSRKGAAQRSHVSILKSALTTDDGSVRLGRINDRRIGCVAAAFRAVKTGWQKVFSYHVGLAGVLEANPVTDTVVPLGKN
jgi:hypothetical protein